MKEHKTFTEAQKEWEKEFNNAGKQVVKNKMTEVHNLEIKLKIARKELEDLKTGDFLLEMNM